MRRASVVHGVVRADGDDLDAQRLHLARFLQAHAAEGLDRFAE